MRRPSIILPREGIKRKSILQHRLTTHRVCQDVINNERVATLEFLNQMLKVMRYLATIQMQKLLVSEEEMLRQISFVSDPVEAKNMYNLLQQSNEHDREMFEGKEINNLIKGNDDYVNGTAPYPPYGSLEAAIDETQSFLALYSMHAVSAFNRSDAATLSSLMDDAKYDTMRRNINYEWQPSTPLPPRAVPIPFEEKHYEASVPLRSVKQRLF